MWDCARRLNAAQLRLYHVKSTKTKMSMSNGDCARQLLVAGAIVQFVPLRELFRVGKCSRLEGRLGFIRASFRQMTHKDPSKELLL